MVKNDKRDEIVRAALELIAEHGFHGAPMAMIAGRAGVGAGTIYRYFENKDVLITELYRDIEKNIMEALQQGYSVEKPFRERFLHLGTELLHHFIHNPLVFRYLEQFHNSPYGVAFRRDKILGTSTSECNVFRELFELGTTQQILKDLPLVILFALFFGPVLSVARDHILGFVELDEVLIHHTIEACWDGIKR
ncbi:MAG: TetR/AcrR family transcriptional regulator [Desulfuromonadaceae bacterium]|nr:TetR/AcrR family transcriptional regulator [Desulfuromonadaceae bacterium]